MNVQSLALARGSRVEGYEIRNVLGIGSFGITYKAYDQTLDCHVAIKEYMPGELALRQQDGMTVAPRSVDRSRTYHQGLERFLSEARALAQFRMPNIVRVFRFLQQNGTAYIIMEYEDGLSLRQYLKRCGTLMEAEVRAIMCPLLKGLRAVHQQSFLHRDIKPGNIYLRRQGTPVLLDFGAARQALKEHAAPSTSVVTPGYAPFEQYNRRDKQGPWTDLYGLGATLYEGITGMIPSTSLDRMAALRADEEDPLTRLTELSPESFDSNLLEIIDWMLNTNAEKRPQSVDDVMGRLDTKEASPDALRISDLVSSGEQITVIGQSRMVPGFNDDYLQKLIKALTRILGPVARVLVVRAANQAQDQNQLLEILTDSISDPADSELFLKRIKAYRRPSSGSWHGSADFRSVSIPSSSRRTGSSRPLTAPMLRTAEKILKPHIGPFSGILVKNIANRCTGVEEFIQRLAAEIPSESEQADFLKKIRRKIRVH